MSSDEQGASADRSGLLFTGLLTLLFIALKLMGRLAWSWVWVLAPIWLAFLCGLGVVLAMIVWRILVD